MEAEQKSKSDNYIQLEENTNTLKLWIRDSKGNETGEYLEFDLEDIELPIRYQELIERDKKNKDRLRNQFIIIEKKQDHKGKKLLSANDEARFKALTEFYKEEVEVYNMFLGENGVQKLLNGANLSWTAFDCLNKIIVEQIKPQLDKNAEDIKSLIIKKYANKRDDVIE